MSNHTAPHAICRLLGGTGRAPLAAVPVPKRPALLLAPPRSVQAATKSFPFSLPLAA